MTEGGNEKMAATKVIVTVPTSLDDRKKTWRKALARVDRSKSNGYAFQGEWLRAGERAELLVGSYVLGYDEPGSRTNWYPQVTLWRVGPQGLEEVLVWKGNYRETSWALAVRDQVAAILAAEIAEVAQVPSPLSEAEQQLAVALRALPVERRQRVIVAATAEQ